MAVTSASFNVEFYNSQSAPNEVKLVSLLPGNLMEDEMVFQEDMMDDVEEVFITGRIIAHPDNVPNKAIVFSSNYGKKEVDLTAVADQVIFHQQIIHLEGINVGNVIKVKNIVRPKTPILSRVDNSPFFGQTKSIIVASGPFNDEDDIHPKRLHRVFDEAKAKNAKCVIIFGPLFVLYEATKKKESTLRDCMDICLNVLTHLAGDFEGCVVVVPPADDDLSVSCGGYPSAPYVVTRPDPDVYMFPNPCVFTCNGLTIALNNYDTLFSIAKSKFITKPVGLNLQDYLADMVSDGNILPTQVVEEDLLMSSFNELPHIFISTSKLQRFAAKCSDTFYVNYKNNTANPGLFVINCAIEGQNEDSGLLKIDASFVDN